MIQIVHKKKKSQENGKQNSMTEISSWSDDEFSGVLSFSNKGALN